MARARYELATCPEQIEEIRRASRHSHLRPIVLPREVEEMINNIGRAKIFTPLPRRHEADDPTDSYLLNLAEVSGAHYLVTGDKKSGLLQRKRVGTASIITAAVFCDRVLRILRTSQPSPPRSFPL
jgi:predicted nucleic acid-binding protein